MAFSVWLARIAVAALVVELMYLAVRGLAVVQELGGGTLLPWKSRALPSTAALGLL